MNLGGRIWLFTESLRLAIAQIVFLAVIVGGLWCLIVIFASLRQKARGAKDRL